MASSSTISNQKSFKYHVFLSFSGEDTRMNFVSHLYAGLKGQGIDTFKDTEELVKGERIDELFKAIENSKFFVIVFSKKYASSSWCLRELAKIMECQKPIERKVYPFFYNVDPADVRQQSGDVGEAFARHKNEHVGKWKKALEDAGNLVGWDLRKRVEAEAIKEIVEDISRKSA
ncbi:hypothetical protein L1887_34127 [Cichorium endivia]|nr:hypothetical protein L1887_34127 [Cichorium endivia]